MGGCTSISPLAIRNTLTREHSSGAVLKFKLRHYRRALSRGHRQRTRVHCTRVSTDMNYRGSFQRGDCFPMEKEPAVFETDILGRCRD